MSMWKWPEIQAVSRKIEHLERYIDHTVLNPTVSREDIAKLCSEAIEKNFRSVCVPPIFVDQAFQLLVSSDVDVCTVIGFPLGYHSIDSKKAEIKASRLAGATEFDIVIPQGLLKSENPEDRNQLLREMQELTSMVHSHYGIVKWIVETAYLNNGELVLVCDYCMEVGADFIKTSTGFAEKGAQLSTVKKWKKQIGNRSLKIKASGGIRNLNDTLAFIKAGADRIGASAGISIIEANEK